MPAFIMYSNYVQKHTTAKRIKTQQVCPCILVPPIKLALPINQAIIYSFKNWYSADRPGATLCNTFLSL